MSRILVVTAVEAESAAVLAGLGAAGSRIEWHQPSARAHGVDVLAGGVGPAAAAGSAGTALITARASGRPYQYVMCLGIGGGFSGRAAIGDVVVGNRSVAADLGAESPEGFLPVDALGFGRNTHDADKALVGAMLAGLPGAREGAILTVSTVTGTAARAANLATAHPDAAAEAMEGFGVATVAALVRVPFVEVRTISNAVGPRDREAWRIGDALAALSAVAAVVGTLDG